MTTASFDSAPTLPQHPVWVYRGFRASDAVEACRSAALEILNGIARGFRKEELATWLDGAYREATRHTHCAGVSHDRHTVGSEVRSIPSQAIEELLARVHEDVLEALRSLRQPDAGVAFAFSALGGGLVVRYLDERGEAVWLPTASMRMRLVDRILSLIAADYLARGDDYTRLSVCARCKHLAFGTPRRGERRPPFEEPCRHHAPSWYATKPACPLTRSAEPSPTMKSRS